MPEMPELTERQRQVLEFIQDRIEAWGYPPTIREVADKFKISVKGSYDHIKALEKKKYLRCRGNRSRAIEVMFAEEDDNDKVSRLPMRPTSRRARAPVPALAARAG